MLVEGLVLGVLLGKIRGGKMKQLAKLPLRASVLLILSFVIQLATLFMIYLGNSMVIEHRMKLYVVSYCLLFIVIFLNMRYRSMWLILIGAIANFAAIILNQGSMPVDLNVLKAIGFENMLQSIQTQALPNYISLQEAFSFTVYLGKRFALPSPYPIKQIFSAGDAFISLGLFFLIQSIMLESSHRRYSSIIRFDHKGRILR